MIDFSHPDVRETTSRQRAAGDPLVSAWVSANAGSGKTHVLTQRVIRLLIDYALDSTRHPQSASPERIVCITFTKAAAAEMQARLFKTLGEWALADDETLAEELEKQLGATPPTSQFPLIRRLFAQALETPGGLKIQTIHSFCESILRRFPVEAGLVPGFRVLEEDSGQLLTDAIADLMEEALTDADHPFGALCELFGDEKDRVERLQSFAARRAEIERWRSSFATQQAEDQALRAMMGVPSEGDPVEWKAAALKKIDRTFLERCRAVAPLATDDKDIPRLTSAGKALDLWDHDPSAAFDHLLNAWTTSSGHGAFKRMALTNKDILAQLAPFKEQGIALSQILADAYAPCQLWGTYRKTKALLDASTLLAERMTAAKEAIGALDFDDLIAVTARLLVDVDRQWVMYKLDRGIDHILLDEAQDTAAGQWRIVEALRDEFISTPSTSGRPRTSFVVGDRKQSIYSFQGADDRLFVQKRQEMAAAIPPPHQFKDLELFLSFRSSPAILRFVDDVFEGPAGAGVHDEASRSVHASAKPDLAGVVEVWPPFANEPTPDGRLLTIPTDELAATDAKRQLAEAIAHQIERWIAEKEPRFGKRKPIQPGDVLILCNSRNTEFFEVIRALVRRGIPTAGADRVKLKEDIAVRDLIALMRFATNHEDNLSLAEALKSPFFGFTEDELFQLAYDRGSTSLWRRLEESANDETSELARKSAFACDAIQAAEVRGAQFGPFAFLSSHLERGSPNGWYRLSQRLGDGSIEALEELLSEAVAFEEREARSLSQFLNMLEASNMEIKKQQGNSSNVVRIMTVHGAKGLEAPIVFLADAGGNKPSFKDRLIEATCPVTSLPLPVAKPTKTGLTGPLVDALAAAEAANDAEYRRKLYVAMTRAEERLIICGTGRSPTKNTLGKDFLTLASAVETDKATWHQLAGQVVARADAGTWTSVDAGWDSGTLGKPDKIYKFVYDGTAPEDEESKPQDSVVDLSTPRWLSQDLPAESAPVVSFPSTGDEGLGVAPDPAISGLPVLGPNPPIHEGGIDPRHRGSLIHSLLQHLPNIPDNDRKTYALRYLECQAPDIPSIYRDQWATEVLAILEDPAFGAVFGEGSRAEVMVHGRVNGRLYSGQIDRLLVRQDEVLVVEYKTHRPPPTDLAEVPTNIRRQVQVYCALMSQTFPGRPVRGAILWTYHPKLMDVPFDLSGT